ncbi:MAG: cation:proton antiporter [Chthoniobacterales bacterium]|nr:cation:proton antiporter [Chthoniobacterales bacterium]
MHHIAFLQDLAIVMIVAAVATILFRQFKQPVVLGYILAGFLIGPHTPPFALISSGETIETLAELGIIFLMFALGLEFSLRKLKAVGTTAVIAATLEILLMIWVGFHLGQLFGWNQMDSIFLGAILAISSTTIIIKALEGLGKTKERFASLIFGILIVEDILAIVMIALLSGFATTGTLEPAVVGKTVLTLSSFLGVLLVAGLIFVPRLLDYVAKFKSNEMLLVTVVGLCFGVSLLTVKLGYSVALGAFMIGAIIAEARQIAKIEALMHPVRDLFSAVFFVSIGLLIDPALLAKYALPIAIITVVVVVGKVVSCSIGCFLAGNDMKTSMRVGMGLAQIGEFSFIIAAFGLQRGVTSDFIYPIAVAVSAVTTLLTPYLIRSSDGFVNLIDRLAPPPLSRSLEAYTRWVGTMGEQRGNSMAARILTKLCWQIGMNVLLVTGVFIAAVFVHQRYLTGWTGMPGGEDGVKALAWLGTMIVSFPLLVAIWRKLEAGAMMVSEISVGRPAAGENTGAFRAIVANTIIVAGTLVMGLWLLVLSSALLPSMNVFILAAVAAVGACFVLYRSSVKLYARAHHALRETFEQVPEHKETTGLPSLLENAELSTIVLPAVSPHSGKMISEIRLRTETGASIVGLERGSARIINPAPDEELQGGDRLLLIGDPDQIGRANNFLLGMS